MWAVHLSRLFCILLLLIDIGMHLHVHNIMMSCNELVFLCFLQVGQIFVNSDFFLVLIFLVLYLLASLSWGYLIR